MENNYREILQGEAAGKPEPAAPISDSLRTRSDQIELLDKYTRFLEERGYIDTDATMEEPFAIDEFLKTFVHKGDEGTAHYEPAPLSLPTYEEREAAISKLFPTEAGSLMDGIITGFHAAIKWYNELLRSEAERRAKG